MGKAAIKLVNSDSDADAIVLRAIGWDCETRAKIKERTGLGYDVIEKVIERNSLDVAIDSSGPIERLHLKAPLTDHDLERARYDEYASHARAQEVEPLAFDEWQPRFGGTSDDIATLVQLETKSTLDADAEETAPLAEPEILAPEPQTINAPEQRDNPDVPLPDEELAKLNPADFVRRFNTFDEFEIDRFFEIMNGKKDGVIWGALEDNREIADFYPRAYYVLIKLLSPYMTEQQQEAVWTLILYVNKEQKG